MVNITIKRDNKRKTQEVPDEEVYEDQVKAQIEEYIEGPQPEEESKPTPKQKGRPQKQAPPPPPPDQEPEEEEITAEDLLQSLARVEAKVDAVGNICAALYRALTTPPPDPEPQPIRVEPQVAQPIRVHRNEQPLEKKKKGLMGFFGK